MNNRELRLSIGDEGRRYAETWSAPATARRVVDIYQGVIEARNTGLEPAVSPS